jgi:hypothetical protein
MSRLSGEVPPLTTTTLPAWYVETRSDAPRRLRIGAQFKVYSCATLRGSIAAAALPCDMPSTGRSMIRVDSKVNAADEEISAG